MNECGCWWLKQINDGRHYWLLSKEVVMCERKIQKNHVVYLYASGEVFILSECDGEKVKRCVYKRLKLCVYRGFACGAFFFLFNFVYQVSMLKSQCDHSEELHSMKSKLMLYDELFWMHGRGPFFFWAKEALLLEDA